MINKADLSFRDFVLDQLAAMAEVTGRPMFGSFALYQDETCFGVINRGRLYFKIDAVTVGEYRKRKMKPFRPNPKQTIKSYYQVPAEILEDAILLREWAERAVRCQAQRVVRAK